MQLVPCTSTLIQYSVWKYIKHTIYLQLRFTAYNHQLLGWHPLHHLSLPKLFLLLLDSSMDARFFFFFHIHTSNKMSYSCWKWLWNVRFHFIIFCRVLKPLPLPKTIKLNHSVASYDSPAIPGPAWRGLYSSCQWWAIDSDTIATVPVAADARPVSPVLPNTCCSCFPLLLPLLPLLPLPLYSFTPSSAPALATPLLSSPLHPYCWSHSVCVGWTQMKALAPVVLSPTGFNGIMPPLIPHLCVYESGRGKQGLHKKKKKRQWW